MVTPSQGDIYWLRFGHSVAKSRLLEKIGTLCKEKLAQVIDGSRTVISQNVFD